MPWYEYSPEPGGALLPLVEITLWRGFRRVRLLALVDSGADTSLLSASYADALGLERDNAQRTLNTGADGSAFATLTWPGTPLEIQFGNERFPFKGAFFDFPPGSDAVHLMGRADFFERFIVQIWGAVRLMNIDLSPQFVQPAVS